MKIKINSAKLTDAPYSKALADAFLFDDQKQLDQLASELKYAHTGAYLISGYRGTGKTSFVNRIKEELNRYVIAELNIAKSTPYPTLLKRIIRQLYVPYLAYSKKNNITDSSLDLDFKLLYDRTFHDVVFTDQLNDKQENKEEDKFEYNLLKFLPYVLVLLSGTGLAFDLKAKWLEYPALIFSALWAGIATWTHTYTDTKTGTVTADLSRKSLYDDDIAEHRLFELLGSLKKNNIKILIVFDELDKLEDEKKIAEVINDLKPLLLSGYASFMVVAGQSFFYELEKSAFLDDLVISTLFTRSVHVAFLKNTTLQKFCLSLIADEADKSNTLVTDYFDAMILESGRIPRKLINLVRADVLWDGKQATIEISEDRAKDLQWRSRILRAVAYTIDNKLAEQADNVVQLDFFTAQVFSWIGKMIRLAPAQFRRDHIFKAETYTERYPSEYVGRLTEVFETLIDTLIRENLLEAKSATDLNTMIFAWILQDAGGGSGNESSSGTMALSDNEGPQMPSAEPDTSHAPNEDEEEEEQEEEEQEEEDEQPELTEEMLRNSSFLQEYASLEAYVRQLYHEIKPDDTKFHGTMRQLIDLLSDLDVLPKGWYNSFRMRSITDARNKLSHGLPIGVEEIDTIQNSAKNISMVRAELNDAYTLLVIKLHFHTWKVEKTTKGGFDILAESPKYHLAVEVKNPVRGGMDDRTINELIDKYSNYITINSHRLYFLVIYFQPPGRKSFDEFFVRFNEKVKEQLPEHANFIILQYITTANDRSIRKQIEEGLDKLPGYEGLVDRTSSDNIDNV